MQKSTIIGACLLAPLALAFAAPVVANPLAQQARQMAYMAGTMHAAAEVCGDYTSQQLDGMLREQKGAVAQMGLSEADFDAEFDKGRESGMAKLESASPEERAKSCEKARSLGASRR